MSKDVSKALDKVRLRLRGLRLENKLTQKEVEERTGIKQPLLSAFESGSRELGLKDILRLCEAYECSAAYVFGEGAPKAPDVYESRLGDALSLEQQLTAGLDDNEKKLVDTYIRLCIYKALRTAYMANPRHKSTKLFKVSQGQLDKALAMSGGDLDEKLAKNLEIKPAAARRIELDPRFGTALREFIQDTEDLIDPPQDIL